MDGIFEAPEKGFCPFVVAHPDRSLTIKDAAAEARWRKSPGFLDLGIRAYAGVALKVGDQPHGTICVQHHAPRAFTRAELALLKTMGHLMSRALESENLKRELQSALDALELSSAIVEDSALLCRRSGLPNRRYLDIWLRSSLFMARRRREPMALALWSQPMVAGTKGCRSSGTTAEAGVQARRWPLPRVRGMMESSGTTGTSPALWRWMLDTPTLVKAALNALDGQEGPSREDLCHWMS
ncbi:MAG: GAF domain-containing protein [Holophagaceae bacterium]|uniref:GAF domain-containing protein n=1 Tax=Candidatus Geothrix skivensis TaxID=2954439 RepID=A0A9D7XHA8_9BACT|nr:GAF domain-containing protein [Candidatus Geothrix skivensis]